MIMRPSRSTWARFAKFALLSATSVLALAAAGGAAEAQSLQDVVRLAITTNPRVGIVASNREATEQELTQARGLWLPQVDLALGIGHEWTNDLSTRARDKDSASLTRQEASVTLIQRVFDGWEADSEIARQKFRVESAANRVYETAEFLGLDAIQAYLEVARQRELRTLAENNVKVHQDILGSLRERLRAGGGSRADVAQTEARLARARATLSQTVNDLRDAEALYLRVVGQAAGNVSRPALRPADLPPSLDAAVELAAKQNPTVQIYESDIKVSDAEVDLAEARFFPRVNIEADATYNDNRDGIESWERGGSVMLRLRWNLYRGGIDTANRREAVSRLGETKNRRYNAFIESQEQMRKSWNALEASRERVGSLNDAVKFNVETRDAYRQQFSVAQRSLLDVLDAENELFVSRGQLISADFNVLSSSYRVMAVAGTLLKNLGVQAPAQSNPAVKSWSDDILQ
jgi:adhesin transport system outer membrane protein